MSRKANKQIFLDKLPRKGKFINWKKSIGYRVKFIYDNICDYVDIVDYDTKTGHLNIKYKDKIFNIYSGSFKNCDLGELLNKNTGNFKVEIGTTFKDNKRDITIIDRKYEIDKNGIRRKWYKYKCNIDGNEDWIEESNLLTEKGCNVCSGKKALLGYNTIYDKAPWMMELGVSEEDAKKYTPQSNKKIDVACSYCGKPKNRSIYIIYRDKSIGCNCGDNISYPNKFMYKFCEQLLKHKQIKSFKIEKLFNWSNSKIYDILIVLNNGQTLIIENHGEQHGKFITTGDLLFIKEGNRFKNSIRNDIKNDSYKCWLAYENNINNYIQLDCSISDLEYIKHSIENSLLSSMFDLTNIDWLKCHKYSLNNLVYEICKYWHEHNEINKEDMLIKDIMEVFNKDRSVIISYLKRGTVLGWCNYDPHKQKVKSALRNNKSKKKVLVYDLDMNYITESESIEWLQQHSIEKFGIYLAKRGISDVCKGEKFNYKGYIFKFK